MAESADVLAKPWQQVILPDLNTPAAPWPIWPRSAKSKTAGNPLKRLGETDLIPLTYMNSAADIKAFCGERGGLVCTSSNARGAFEWAFKRAKKILFLPEPAPGPQHCLRHGHPAQ